VLEVPKYDRIRMRYINRGVYARTKCSIISETLNPKNLVFYTDSMKKNVKGYLILDEFILAFVKAGLLRL
jgi:hypothetical protein